MNNKNMLVKHGLSYLTLLLSIFLLLSYFNFSYAENKPLGDQSVRIKLKFNGQQAIAELEDNPTTQSLLTQLPITITFEDYAHSEKIAPAPKSLTVAPSHNGHDPKAGDIAYYSPWNNLCFYYSKGTASGNLIYIGKFISGLEAFSQQGSKFNVTIEQIE